MRKIEHVANIARRTKIPQRIVKKVVTEMYKEIGQSLIDQGSFRIDRVGQLNVVTRAARRAFNMHANEEMQLPPKKVIKFQQSKNLKLE